MSTSNDFDFLHGDWHVQHRKLRTRLTGDATWDEFDGRATCQPALAGTGIVDDNWLDDPNGAYTALAVRTFDPATAAWSIWWFDGRMPHRLDPPVVGRFDGGRGTFTGEDLLDGRPIVVRFTWTDVGSEHPRWEQAFSADGEATWEVNWVMTLTRLVGG